MICIWCLQDFDKLSLEHAIPEALACPPYLELNNIACEECNSALGTVDQGLIKQFELITVMYGVPRKKGKPPTIDTWRGMRSIQKPSGPHIYINGSKQVVKADGKNLHPATKASGVTDIWASPESAQVGLSHEFGNDQNFLPALYKIGLSLVGMHFGPEVAANSLYNHVRAFVRSEVGAPALTAGMSAKLLGAPTTGASNPFAREGLTYPLFEIMILGVTFLLDLAPDQPGLQHIRGTDLVQTEALYFFPPKIVA